ncbi:MAG: iron-containing alcohol dehydrogenase [Spirochaetes bacterium]|nr:iron-containing alcohol dehydrogenase [Spirochaetota bacterium]
MVPTAIRDPFLLGDRFVVTDSRNRKACLLSSGNGGACAVVMDPNLQSGLSQMTAEIALLDAIMACIEGSISSQADFFSDSVLERAIHSLVHAFDMYIQRPDDPNARLEACRGAFLASAGIATSSLGVGSAITFAINARFKVPKANIAAVLLPYLMEIAVKYRIERIAAFAPAFGVTEEEGRPLPAADAASRVVEAVRTRLGMIKIPSRLKDFEIDLDRLMEAAETARSLEISSMMPRVVSVDDVFDLIKTAY